MTTVSSTTRANTVAARSSHPPAAFTARAAAATRAASGGVLAEVFYEGPLAEVLRRPSKNPSTPRSTINVGRMRILREEHDEGDVRGILFAERRRAARGGAVHLVHGAVREVGSKSVRTRRRRRRRHPRRASPRGPGRARARPPRAASVPLGHGGGALSRVVLFRSVEDFLSFRSSRSVLRSIRSARSGLLSFRSFRERSPQLPPLPPRAFLPVRRYSSSDAHAPRLAARSWSTAPAALRRHRERRVEPPREEAASEQVREDAIPALGDPRRPRRPVGFEPGVFRLRAFGFTVVVVVVPAVVVPIVVSDAEASGGGDAHRPRGALAGVAREQDEPLRLHEEEGLLRVQEQPRAARVAQLREVFPSAAEHLRDAGSLAPRRDGDGVGRDPRGGAPRRAQVPEPRRGAGGRPGRRRHRARRGGRRTRRGRGARG